MKRFPFFGRPAARRDRQRKECVSLALAGWCGALHIGSERVEAGFHDLECTDCTEKVDRRMVARLMEVRMRDNPYERALGTAAKVNGEFYYETMLATHFAYLKYGVIIAEKIETRWPRSILSRPCCLGDYF